MRYRSLVAGLTGAVVLGLGLVPLTTTAEAAAPAATAAPAAAPTVPTPPPISWGKCQDKRLTANGGECGMLTVPLDYANPTGATIQLAVSRVLHTKGGTAGKGAVFTNPGGPGGEGQILAAYGQFVPKKAGLAYDWYGMDPRGVGHSVPALGCGTDYPGSGNPSYDPTTPQIENFWLTKAAAYAAACAASPAKALLPHLKTTDNAMDFESLRLAIGQSQITWYGFSYGTYIGQVYATLFPGSLKAMILDGVLNASQTSYVGNLDQDSAFQKSFKGLEKWMAKYHQLYRVGKSKKQVDSLFNRTVRKLTKKPVLHGKIGGNELKDAMSSAAYLNLIWPDVAAAYSQLVNTGNAHLLKKFLASAPEKGVPSDNGNAIYLATQCTDSPWPTDYATWKADNTALAVKNPLLTWSNAWLNMPCRTWGVPASPLFQVTGAYTGPVLLTSEQFDPATPYSGALATRALFANSALVEGKGGTSHAVSLDGVSCIDNSVAQLLKKGTLPTRKAGNRADLACKGLQPPNPLASDSATAGRRALFTKPNLLVR